ncbi:MAG: small multi-drug export protein [Oscillospiraceae bacterium]|nr:small multi-drug export protein [Oscillospiraceae bacterium]
MLLDILKTLFTAMLPVLEIRGAIPVGIAAGLDPWLAFAIGVVGNMLPIPILILITRHIINWMKKHGILVRFTEWLERKGEKKAKTIQQYSFWGLFILVAIPLPGTGAWTGALAASLLDMRLKNALPAILMGVIVAGIIVMLLTFGVISVGSLA